MFWAGEIQLTHFKRDNHLGGRDSFVRSGSSLEECRLHVVEPLVGDHAGVAKRLQQLLLDRLEARIST